MTSAPTTDISQQTRVIRPMLFQCWTSVEDAGPTLKRHWANSSCLLDKALLDCHQSESTFVIQIDADDLPQINADFGIGLVA